MRVYRYWMGHVFGLMPAIVAECKDRDGPLHVYVAPERLAGRVISGPPDPKRGWSEVPVGDRVLWPSRDRVYVCERDGVRRVDMTEAQWAQEDAAAAAAEGG